MEAKPWYASKTLITNLVAGAVAIATAFGLDLGFTGFGFLQHGPTARRFIHLDDIPPGGHHPRPWPWTY